MTVETEFDLSCAEKHEETAQGRVMGLKKPKKRVKFALFLGHSKKPPKMPFWVLYNMSPPSSVPTGSCAGVSGRVYLKSYWRVYLSGARQCRELAGWEGHVELVTFDQRNICKL